MDGGIDPLTDFAAVMGGRPVGYRAYRPKDASTDPPTPEGLADPVPVLGLRGPTRKERRENLVVTVATWSLCAADEPVLRGQLTDADGSAWRIDSVGGISPVWDCETVRV